MCVILNMLQVYLILVPESAYAIKWKTMTRTYFIFCNIGKRTIFAGIKKHPFFTISNQFYAFITRFRDVMSFHLWRHIFILPHLMYLLVSCDWLTPADEQLWGIWVRALSVLSVVIGLWCSFPSLSVLESLAFLSFSNSWIGFGPPHPTITRFHEWLLCWYLGSASDFSSLCLNVLFVTKLGFYFSDLDLGLPFCSIFLKLTTVEEPQLP